LAIARSRMSLDDELACWQDYIREMSPQVRWD